MLGATQHDTATSAGTTCTSLASTPPIGTAWLALGGELCTNARRGRTPAGANDLGRREAHTHSEKEREFFPWHHPGNKSHLGIQSGQ